MSRAPPGGVARRQRKWQQEGPQQCFLLVRSCSLQLERTEQLIPSSLFLRRKTSFFGRGRSDAGRAHQE